MAGENIDIYVNLHDKVTRGVAAIQHSFGMLRGVVSNIGSVLTSFQAQLAGLGVALAGGAVVQKSITLFAEFDDVIRAAGASMKASPDQFKMITEAAKEMGKTTRYSASQAAEGLKTLAYSGLSANQAVSALPRVLNMAAAGGIDLGTAAGIATGVMNGFNLQVEDLAQITDVLTHVFTSSDSTLQDLGEGFKMVAAISAQTGGDFEELATVIGKLHDANIKGTSSGTALRAALSKLLNPAGDAEEMLSKLNARIGGTGLQVKDANGNFVGFVSVIKQLEEAGLRGDEALRLFGEEAGPAMAYLVGIGSDALEKLVDKTRDVEGTTKKISAEMEGGLGGALRALNSAYEAILISFGEAFSEDIINAVKRLTEWFINLIGEIEGLKEDGTLEKWGDGASKTLKAVWFMVKETAAAFDMLGKSIAVVALFATGNFKSAGMLAVDTAKKHGKEIAEQLGLTEEEAMKALEAVNKRGADTATEVFYQIDKTYGTVVKSVKEKTGELGKLIGHADVAGLKAAEAGIESKQKPIGQRTKADAPLAEPPPKVSAQAAAKASADRMRADLAVEMTALEIMYDQGQKVIADFYAGKENLIRNSIQNELATIDSMYQQGKQVIADFYSEKERLMRASIGNEVQLLEKQLSGEKDVDKRAAIDSQIYSKKKELEEQLLQLTADRVAAEVQLEQDKIAALERQNQNRLNMERTFADIKARVEAGDKGQFEAQFQQEMFELQERHQREHQVLVDAKANDAQFMELARAQELERAQVQEEQVRRVMEFRLETAATIAGGMSQIFDEMYQAGGEKNKAMFYASKALAIAEATMKISQAVVGALGSPPYGVAAMGTAAVIAAMGGVQLAKIMSTNLAEGGRVPGHSPHPKADNIVARLTADEFVQPVAAVKYYGLPFMEAIRTLSLPRESVFDLGGIRIPRDPGNFRYTYAEGGSVKGAPEAPAAGAAQQNFDIVNVVDQSVFDQYLGSTTGKKALMNIIRSNAYELKNAMAAEM